MARPAHHPFAAPAGALAARQVVRRAVPLALIVVAFALRAAGSVDRPLWFDEGYSIYFAGASPLDTAVLTAVDIHPPFYYWTLQLWTLLAGWNELSVRLYSAAVGTLTVALLLAFGVRAFGRRAGWIAATALAVSPLHVTYSFEVRMYALLALLVLIATWVWWRLDSRRSIALYTGAMAMACLTQYYAVFVLAAHALTIPLLHRTGRRLLALAGALIPLAVWTAYAGPQLASYVRTKVAFEAYPPLDPIGYFGGFAATAFGGGTLGTAAALVIGFLAVAGIAGRLRALPLLLASVVTAPLVLGFLVNLLFPFNPPGWERLFLFVLPPWLLLAAHGAVRWAWRLGPRPVAVVTGGTAAGIVAAASLGGSFAAVERRPADDPRPMIRAIERQAVPSDLYLAIYPWQVGYLRLYDRRPLPEIRLVPADRWAADQTAMTRDLAQWADGRRVWLPAYQRLGRVLETRLERAFSEQLYLISADWYGDHRLLFSRAAVARDIRARDVRFGDLALAAAIVDSSPVESGIGSAAVELLWDGPHDGANVHLRLADSRGITWAQHDAPLARDWRATRDRRAVLIPAGTPPGRYRLLLSLSRGDALLSAVRPGFAPAPELDLGEVEVILPRTPPTPETLMIGRPLRRAVAPELELLGSDFASGPYRPGDSVLVSLYWLSLGDQPPEVTVRIGGATSAGPPPHHLTGQPVREIRELIVRDRGRLPVILETPAGVLALGEIEVRERDRQPAAPTPAVALDVRFGDRIRLVGASVSSPGGETLTEGRLARVMDVELIWRSDAPLDDDLAVFVHLVGADGRPVAQHDSRPANGAAPTRGWLPGETIVDRHRLSVPETAGTGEYRIIVGLYRPPNGPRLPTATGDSATIHRGALP